MRRNAVVARQECITEQIAYFDTVMPRVFSPLHNCAVCTRVFTSLLAYDHTVTSTYRIPVPSQRIASVRSCKHHEVAHTSARLRGESESLAIAHLSLQVLQNDPSDARAQMHSLCILD
jgi:hypothetical protein